MAEIIETPFGAFQQLPGGGFQPVYQTPFGNFVSTPGGGFAFANQPAAPTTPGAPAGGGTEAGTETVKCDPPYVYDEETNSCMLPADIQRRNEQRSEDERRQREQEQRDRQLADQRRQDEEAAAQRRAESRESAKAIIGNLLEQYGLGNLTDFVNNLITTEDIVSGDVILGRIRMTEQYKARFAGNEARRKSGFNALSEAEYVNLENTYRQLMRASGLPQGFYDQNDDFVQLIAGDVSPAELSNRINNGYLAVQQANPQVVNEMRRLYGVDDSALAAYFLDPAKATPILLRQAQAAQIAGEATLQAQRELTAAQAEQLAVAGVSPEQARAGFQTIAAAEELFVPLPGTTEQAITQEEQMAGVFGTSAAAQQRLRQRSRERAAAFEAGGRFAGQGTTVTGLQ